MTERETTRATAWAAELRRVHLALRSALDVAREAVQDGDGGPAAARTLLLYCHGFCAALAGHHQGEDRILFPAVEAAHPHLGPVLRALQQDHSMIAHLLQELGAAVDEGAPHDELERHLDGVAAIMENHFRYEERQLLHVLEGLGLEADTTSTLGPL